MLRQATHTVILLFIQIDERSISRADELIQSKKTPKDLYSFSQKHKEEFGCHTCYRKCSLTLNRFVFCFLTSESRNVGITNGNSFSTTCKNEHFPLIYKKTITEYIITRDW